MSAVFSREGWSSLKFAWIGLGLALVAAAAVVLGSYWYLQKEQRDDTASRRQLAEAQSRVAAARKEVEDLRTSAKIFEDLVKRGLLQEESRLAFIERFDRLKAQHRLLALDYEIAPQRALPLAGGRVFNAVDVLGSRVKLKAQALHEAELLAFLEDLARPASGFHRIDRCTLRKLEPGPADTVYPTVEAQCWLEWVSLRDKRGGRAG